MSKDTSPSPGATRGSAPKADTELRSKERLSAQNAASSGIDASSDNDNDYPHGLKLFFIVVALLLSILLVSPAITRYSIESTLISRTGRA